MPSVGIVLQTFTILTTLTLSVLWLTPVFPSYNPFARKAGDALEQLYSMNERIGWETKDRVKNSEKYKDGSSITRDQTGFEWVRRAIIRNRPGVRSDTEKHGQIKKIVLVEGDGDLNYQGIFGPIIPGNFAFVEFDDGQIVPFLEDEREQRMISTWTNREIERTTNSIIFILVLLWTLFSLLSTWFPYLQ